MKVNVYLKSFGAGVLACAALLGVYSFTLDGPKFDQGGDGIGVEQAKMLHRTYMQNDPPLVNGAVQAIEVSDAALSIMNDVSKSNSGFNGVRLYFGLDSDGNTANVVVATADGKDMTSGYMRVSVGPATACPTVCDRASPIMK